MTEPTARARISAGYETQTVDPEASRRHDRAIGAGFCEHADFERLIRMPARERDDLLDRMGATMRLSFGHYREARAAFHRLEKGSQR